MEEEGNLTFDTLPNEMFVKILQRCEDSDLFVLRIVCKDWYETIKANKKLKEILLDEDDISVSQAEWLYINTNKSEIKKTFIRAAINNNVELFTWAYKKLENRVFKGDDQWEKRIPFNQCIMYACERGHVEMVALLSSYGYPPRGYIMHAIMNGKEELVFHIVENETDIPNIYKIWRAAACRGHKSIVEYLYNKGFCPEIESEWPCVAATKAPDTDVLEYFILTCRYPVTQTAINSALYNGNIKILQFLYSNGLLSLSDIPHDRTSLKPEVKAWINSCSTEM